MTQRVVSRFKHLAEFGRGAAAALIVAALTSAPALASDCLPNMSTRLTSLPPAPAATPAAEPTPRVAKAKSSHRKPVKRHRRVGTVKHAVAHHRAPVRMAARPSAAPLPIAQLRPLPATDASANAPAICATTPIPTVAVILPMVTPSGPIPQLLAAFTPEETARVGDGEDAGAVAADDEFAVISPGDGPYIGPIGGGGVGGVGGGGVPEPATWALMVAGFGLSGAALRRARRRGV